MHCAKPVKKVRDSLFVCADGHENWVNPPVGSIAFILKGRKVFYGIRSREPGKGKLDPPGGMVEIGDTAEQTIVRETKEETGLDIEIIQPLGTYATTYLGRPILDIMFIAKATSDHVVPGDDMNGGEPVWIDIEELPPVDQVAVDWIADAQKDLLVWWHKNQDKFD